MLREFGHWGRELTSSSRFGAGILSVALLALGCGGSVVDDQPAETLGVSEQELHTVAGKTWTPIGPGPITNAQQNVITPTNPATGAGRAVVPHPTDPNIIYFGGVNAGIWRTNNATATQPTWTPLTDTLPSLSIGALALDRTNANVIMAGTGLWSSYYTDGGSQGDVYLSTNGGTSFSVISNPLFQGQKISSVVVRGGTMLVASLSFAGLARSANSGAAWTQISGTAGTGLPNGNIDELIEDRQNANRLWATMSGTGVFRSDNLGATWVNVSQNDQSAGGLNQAITGSFEAARMATSNDGRAYVAVVQNGLVGFVAYTTNGGTSWTRMEAPNTEARGLPWFHFAIAADPTSSNFVYIAGDLDWRRGNASLASNQWTDLADSGTPSFTSPHADVRDIEFDANGNYIEVGDGGIFRRPTPRGSADWQSLAGNLQSAEFHDVSYDVNSGVAFGGTQDNGTPMQPATGSLGWNLFMGGDGGDVQTDVTTSPGNSIRYTSFQNLGGFTAATFNAAGTEISRTSPALSPTAGGQFFPQFYTPVALNRSNARRIAFGMADAVYESLDQGQTITSLGNAGSASEIVYGHPTSADVLYAVSGGTVFRRLTAGAALASTPTSFPTFDARELALSNTSAQTAYVIGAQSVFSTTNAGTSWTNITGNLLSFQPGDLRAVEFIPGTPHGLIVVGTNRGVFAAGTDAPTTWTEVGNLPNAPVKDLQYYPQKDLLIAGLLGRGAWTVTGLGGNQQTLTALPRTGWVASASNTNGADVPANALDGNASTRYSSGVAQSNATTHTFTVDMQSAKTFSQITLESGTDYARSYQVFVSNDGINWGTAIASGSSTTALTTITFTQVTARYIQVRQTTAAGVGSWWSIYEFNVYSATSNNGGSALSRTGWVLTASATGGADVASRAIDGSAATRWSSGQAQSGATTQTLTIDMASAQAFDKITLDSAGDYARNYQVFVSNNGTTWGTAVATGTGVTGTTTITFAPQNARYIQIRQTTSAGTGSWWSVYELNVYSPSTAPLTALSRTGWAATASSTALSPALALDGNASTRWATSAAQVPNQFYQVDMISAKTFRQITLDTTASAGDYPRGYQVFVSADGANWGSAIASGTPTTPVVTITFAAQTARFIKVVQTGSVSPNWWSLYEMNVYN
jgi:hypothetical protein